MTLSEEKQALRRDMRARLRALSPAECISRSAGACAQLQALPAFQNAAVLLAYCAMPGECDPAAAVDAARAAGKRVAFPLCLAENRLALYEPVLPDALLPGKYGILEPVPARCRRVAPGEVDFAIIPGLAFGRDCSRLGRGAGYYDRLLPEIPGVKAGLAFDFQIVTAVPCGKWDAKMDLIAENNGIIVNKMHSCL